MLKRNAFRHVHEPYSASKRFLYYHTFLNPIYEFYCDMLCFVKSNLRLITTREFEFKMIIDLRDKGASRDLFIHRIREPVSALLYAKILKEKSKKFKDMTILEAGANIGYYALLGAFSSQSTIYAVEPNITAYKLLKLNISVNNVEHRFKTYNIALSDVEGTIHFILDDHMNWSRPDPNEREGVLIQATTIDNLLNNTEANSIYIRLDVDGYEYKILQGANKTLKKVIGMFVEVHPASMKSYGYSFMDFCNFLSRYDFKLRYIVKPLIYRSPPLFKVMKRQFSIRPYDEYEIIEVGKPIRSLCAILNEEYRDIVYHMFLES